ncbi:hypothetical protein RYX36_015815 [Vicia faba]
MNGEECEEMERVNEKLVYMWGYLPGALPQRTPLLSPVLVRAPANGCNWKDVSGGGCGFAMAISEQGKLITWGSTDDLGQSYVTSGKHGETPEPFPLPDEVSIVQAASAWAHCVAVTDCGEVYTWGWKECIPSGKLLGEPLPGWTFFHRYLPLSGGGLSLIKVYKKELGEQGTAMIKYTKYEIPTRKKNWDLPLYDSKEGYLGFI